MTNHESPDHNIVSYLGRAAARHPDRKAIVYPLAGGSAGLAYRQLTFAQLDEQVSRLASSLRGLGLARGDRAVVMVPMSIELYVLILALLKAGAVIMVPAPGQGLGELARATAFVEPRAFIGVLPAHVLRLYSAVFRRIPLQVVSGGPALFGEARLERLIAGGDPDFPVTAVRPDDTALITFTTGSTGVPKGVNRTHGLLVAQHLALARNLGMGPDDVDLPAFPVLVLNNLALGATSVVPRFKPSRPARVRPELLVRQIRDHGVTTAAGSPAYFRRLADHCAAAGERLETLRLLFTGGAPVDPALLETLAWMMPNGVPHVVYGSTEAEPVSHIDAATVLQETAALTRAGRGNCVGRPVPDVRVKIVRVQDGPIDIPGGWEGVELPRGEIGEIVVTGAHVGKDYYRNPEAVRQAKIRDPEGEIWHRMGDVGYLDEGGRIWLVGRVNNIVRSRGATYYPVQVEAIVEQLPWVRRAALIGLPGEDGEDVALAIEPVPGRLPRLFPGRRWQQEVLDHCRANDILVDRVFFRRAIPVDPRHNAKIEYARLRAEYGRGITVPR